MSYPLLKTTAKKNWVLLLIFFGVLTMYLSIMISMYDPDNMEALTSMMDLLPKDLMNALGFGSLITDLTGYLASWLYGLLMLAFPMVYCIILGNRLVAKMVDNGSFAYLLSTPASRVKIIITQGAYALLSIAVLFTALAGMGIVICEALFPGLLDIGAFVKLNFTTMLVNMTVMMICFFFSCLFNDSKLATGVGAGIPIAFLLLNMLGGVSPDAEILKKISIYGLYDPVELVHGGDILFIQLFFVAVILVLFAGAVLIFKRKRLPL